MTIDVNIGDYLSHDEIKEIIKEQVRVSVRNAIGEKDYIFVQKLAKELAKQGAQELIPNYEQLMNDHIKNEIESIKIENLFWETMGWKSNGNKIINKVLAAHEDLIAAKVKQLFKNDSSV